MVQFTTKDRILIAALTLFSEKGYGAVSVSQIADSVGIKAPSLYKHYKSKQDIFDAILKEMAIRYEKQMTDLQMDGTKAGKDADIFALISEDHLVALGKQLFLYFLHDEYTSKFRRMLAIEQYRSGELACLYTKQYFDDPLSYQGMMFGLLAQAGAIVKEEPHIMALHFYAPMYLLLTLCDVQPEREVEAIDMVEQHIKQFSRIYRSKER